MVQICKKGRAKCHDPAQASQTICYLLEHKLLKMDMVKIEEMRSEHLTEVLRLISRSLNSFQQPVSQRLDVEKRWFSELYICKVTSILGVILCRNDRKISFPRTAKFI
mgnify:CR=1 FL=1